MAKELDIPKNHIFANKLTFYHDGKAAWLIVAPNQLTKTNCTGTYAAFDEKQPTSEQDGKPRVIGYLKQRFAYRNIVMVGDGATDLAAAPPAVSLTQLQDSTRL